jgi:hypothetical protein
MRVLSTVGLLALGVAYVAFYFPQAPRISKPGSFAESQSGHLKIEATVKPTVVSASEQAQVKVVLTIDSGYHINAPQGVLVADQNHLVPTSIVLTGPGIRASKVTYPTAVTEYFRGKAVLGYDNVATIEAAVAPTDAWVDLRQVDIKVTAQACDDKTCLVPQTAELTLGLHVRQG